MLNLHHLLQNEKPYSLGKKKNNIGIKKDIYYIAKRYMFKSKGVATEMGTRLMNPMFTNRLDGHVRGYPGQLISGRFTYDARTASGKTPPKHENNHTSVKKTDDDQIIGVLTTDPKPTFDSMLLNDKEYADGTSVSPNSPPGTGQYLGFFNNSKIVDTPAYETKKPIWVKNEQFQAYLDRHEEMILEALRKRSATPEVRLSKEDSRFYHENGQRDYENFP